MSRLNISIGRPAAWIEVTGEDSFNFLQGQSTNDLRSPAPRPATYVLWLDRKGKVLADSFVLQDAEDRFYLFSYHSPADSIIERLEAFIIADDVALRDMTPHAVSAAVWGEGLPDALAGLGVERPDAGSFLRVGHRFLLPGRRSARLPNLDFLVVGPDNEEAIGALSSAVLNAGGDLVGGEVLERERIESAIPSVPWDVGPTDLPQEGNLDDAAISYNKGCYLGQEVMARIRSMGQVRRTLASVSLPRQPETNPTPLFHGSKEVGSLRTTTLSAPFVGLALIRTDLPETAAQLASKPDGPAEIKILNT